MPRDDKQPPKNGRGLVHVTHFLGPYHIVDSEDAASVAKDFSRPVPTLLTTVSERDRTHWSTARSSLNHARCQHILCVQANSAPYL